MGDVFHTVSKTRKQNDMSFFQLLEWEVSKITLDGSFWWPKYDYFFSTHSAPATTEDVAHTMCRAGTCLSE